MIATSASMMSNGQCCRSLFQPRRKNHYLSCIAAIKAQSISTTTSRTRSKRRSLETIACHYRLWQHIHMCRKAAPQREVWRQLRVITDWGRKVESPCQVQNCVANPEASRLAPFTAPMGSVWVTSPMEHFQQCQFVTRAWTQQIPLPMTSSGELGESKTLSMRMLAHSLQFIVTRRLAPSIPTLEQDSDAVKPLCQ